LSFKALKGRRPDLNEPLKTIFRAAFLIEIYVCELFEAVFLEIILSLPNISSYKCGYYIN
jgi:hypothetical protein